MLGELAIGHQFGVGKIAFGIFRKQVEKYRSIALPVKSNRSEAS